MKNAVEKILRSLGKLNDFQNGQEFHVRINNGPYMPLVIERHGSMATVSHYYEQNGDSVPDPDMEFRILPDGSWLPVAIQHNTGHYSRAIFEKDGKEYVRIQALKELKSFARMWACNLLAQKFQSGQVVRSSSYPE